MKSNKKRKKILLVRPALFGFQKSFSGVSPPLGLAYIGAILEKNGFEVKILDLEVEPMDKEEYKKFLRGEKPDLVGFTAWITNFYIAKQVINFTKEILPSTLTVLGGPAMSNFKERILKKVSGLDIGIYGEGDYTFLEVAEGRKINSIQGIMYRENNIIKINPPRPLIKNLDNLPWPARHLLNMERYAQPKNLPLTILTSRGCPYQCTFCTTFQVYGRGWRGRSIKDVVNEIEFILKRYSHLSEDKTIHIIDDLFAPTPERIIDFCNEILNRNLKLGFSIWGMRSDLLNKKLVKLLKKAGCKSVFLGIETGSQKVLDSTQKKIKVSQTEKSVRMLKDYGIRVNGNVMIGNIGENYHTSLKTLDFVKKLDLDFLSFNFPLPTPGTPLYEAVKRNGKFLIKDWQRWNDYDSGSYKGDSPQPIFETEEFSAEQRIKTYNEFRKVLKKYEKIPPRPISQYKKALIKLHYKCNNNCIFCHAKEKKDHPALRWRQIVRKIIQARKLGVEMVIFSGGEPTIHPDFQKIVDFLHRNKISFGLITNGRMFSYYNFTKYLLDKGLKYVYLTLHSANGAQHDEIARTKGAFNQTVGGLKNLTKYSRNLEIIVNTVVIKQNLHQLKEIIDFLSKFSVSKVKFSLVEPRGGALENFETVVPELEKAALKIRSALKYGLNKKIDVYFDNLPFCLMENFLSRKDDLFTNNILYMSETFENKFYPVDQGETRKLEVCKKCFHFQNCPGIFSEYLKRRKPKEIGPVYTLPSQTMELKNYQDYKKRWENYYRLPKENIPWFNWGKPDKFVVDFINYYSLKEKSNILDAGCGVGRNSRYLAEKNYIVTGIDLSDFAIQIAKKNVPQGSFFAGDICKNQFKTSFFDAIIDVGCLHGNPDKKRREIIKEYERISKKGAKLFIHFFKRKENQTNKKPICFFHGLPIYGFSKKEILDLVKGKFLVDKIIFERDSTPLPAYFVYLKKD